MLMDEGAVHEWFGLTYAAYLVIPRSVLQSLPGALQRQLVDALAAAEAYFGFVPLPAEGEYDVRLRDSRGRFISDPLRDYERGRRVVTKEELLGLGSAVEGV